MVSLLSHCMYSVFPDEDFEGQGAFVEGGESISVLAKELFWGYGDDNPFDNINNHAARFLFENLADVIDEEDFDPPLDGLVPDIDFVSLPATDVVLESLDVVELRKDDLSNGEWICAVCSEGLLQEEIVNKLPCSHCYHAACIVPWLKKRNTCRLCRFVLPIDDKEDYKTSSKKRRTA